MSILKDIINYINGANVSSALITVDGVCGAKTIKAMQKHFGTTQDGVISGQNKSLRKYYPAITSVKYGTGGSACIKKLQKWLGVTQDGVLGPATIRAWQKKLGVTQDGIFGSASAKAWQKYLNANVKVSNGSKIGALANSYAYATNTAKAAYKGGAATSAYTKGLAAAYPDRSKWGAAPKKGASCDVFVGTCVRNSGIDKTFPRGLDEQIKHLAKSTAFKAVSVSASTVQDGDIIVYSKTSGGGHVCIAYGGKIKEAGYQHYYPKTTNTLKSRLSKSGKKWLKVYRAK